MATLTFSFDTGNVPLSKIVDAFASYFAYQTTLLNGDPNPETKTQFARRMIKEHVIMIVHSEDLRAARLESEAEILPITLT